MVIYLITNKVNGKMYVGKAKNFKRRISRHKSSINNLNKKYPIVNAFRQYGWENFDFKILEFFDETANIQVVLDAESKWIKRLNSIQRGYNVLERHIDWTGQKHSSESKQKMSESHKKFCGKNHPRYGTHHSVESKQKMSAKKKIAYLGNKNPFWGKRHSLEAKQKISAGNKKRDFSYRNRAVKQIDPKSFNLIKIWPSAKIASISLGSKNGGNIGLACKGVLKTALGFRWEYV